MLSKKGEDSSIKLFRLIKHRDVTGLLEDEKVSMAYFPAQNISKHQWDKRVVLSPDEQGGSGDIFEAISYIFR